MTKFLYIEGTSDTDNGSLRVAFAKLLEKELKGAMPRIVMGDGKNQTIDKFHSKPIINDEKRFLLVDSDIILADKDALLRDVNNNKPNRKIDCSSDNTFFMVQEAEAWILSQPDVLRKCSIDVSKLPKKNVMEITKPSEKLSDLYKKSNLVYHKVSEFSRVFTLLDTKKLMSYFKEFNGLISTLKNA